MTDNVAGQFGFGYGSQWLIWVALIALIIYIFCTPYGGGCC
ncbi:MAG: hypothetical protein ACOWWO_13620 [Peptococcaceae bacterium]